MRKYGIIVCCMILSCIALSGCKEKDADQSAKTDVEMETPEFIVEKSEQQSTQRDYGDKQVQNGFWIRKIQDKTGTWYRYIPMMTQKIPGIYDLEDAEENKDSKSFGVYNRPRGTEYLLKQCSGFDTEFGTNPLLGFNSDENASDAKVNPEVDEAECFSFVGKNNKYSIESCDVGCVTFAFYNDIYEEMPNVNVQVYGISEGLWNSMMGQEKDWNFTSYRNLINSCKEQDYANCTFLSEKEIAESGIYYIDYAALEKQEVYKQYLVVYRFSKCTSCAYCIRGNLLYNISDQQTYQEWKDQHIDQFIAG